MLLVLCMMAGVLMTGCAIHKGGSIGVHKHERTAI